MKRLRSWYRPMLLAICLALCFLFPSSLLVVGSTVAQARGLSAIAQPVGPHGKSIDWVHPVRVQPIHSHSGLEKDLPPNTVPLYTPPKAGLAVQANFPTNCYNNWAYYVWANGQDSWTYTNGNYQATVWYMWCPTYSGDPIGINWGQGHINVSGCGHVGFGVYGLYGAVIYDSSNKQYWDGESPTSYYVCNSFAWDDSVTVRGDGIWAVAIYGYVPDGPVSIGVTSPCCY